MTEGNIALTVFRRRLPTALIVLVSGFLIAFFVTLEVRNSVEQRSEQLFTQRMQQISSVIQLRLARVQDDLAAAAGLFAASDEVSRSEWRNFFDSRTMTLGSTTTESINFLQRVPLASRSAFELRVRNDTSLDGVGYPQFAIRPEGQRSQYYVISYVHPSNLTDELMGFDSLSDPIRSNAILAAQDDIKIHAIALPQLLEGEPGIVPYMPVVKNGAVIGMTTAAFSYSKIFESAVFNGSDVTDESINFDVYDGMAAKPVMHIGAENGSRFPRAKSVEWTIGGMTVLLVAHATHGYGLGLLAAFAPWLLGGFVVLLTLITYIALYFIESSRERAIEVARGLTEKTRMQTQELEEANKKLSQRVESGSVSLDDKVSQLEQSRSAMVSLLEDLTQSRDQIEEARAYEAAVIESIADSAVTTDVHGFVVQMNRAAETMLGVSRAAAKGRPIERVVQLVNSSDGRPISEDNRPYMLSLRNKSVTRSKLYSVITVQGAKIPISLESAPILLNGEARGVVDIFHDISEELRVDRAKSEFVSLASHQLRTPLTAIGWYAELLKEDAGPRLIEQDREYIDEIYRANRRMIDLVDSLLNVSRIEMGSFNVSPALIDLTRFIEDELMAFAPLVNAKNLTVRRQIQPGIPPYLGDQKLLALMAQNLISNAVKYTPISGTITVSLAVNDKGAPILSVADTGIGIPREAWGKMYEKLFRADNAQIAEAEGSGLGLYLVKSVLDQVGGTIRFTSEVGKGTTFTIELPVTGMKPQSGSRPIVPADGVGSVVLSR